MTVTAAAELRTATRADLEAIVRMLADDSLGSTREDPGPPLPDRYVAAFEAIDRSSDNELLVADLAGEPVGVLQLTFIPYLTYRGGRRALIEGVRVASSVRARGIGRQMIEAAIERARAKGCVLVQLTTDKTRPDALHFYESLGFVASHEGMKLRL